MALDKRLPAVYVEIEDQSYMSESIEAGRTAYCCLISDRGPHNQIVELNSRQDLYDLFGKPNFSKYGQGHYFIDQHLKRSGKIYVVRPVILTPPDGSNMKPEDCCSIANTAVRFNNPENKGHSTLLTGNYVLTKGRVVVCPATNETPTGSPQKEPSSTVDLPNTTLNIGDYIQFKFSKGIGNTPVDVKIVIDPAILSAMKTADGYDITSYLDSYNNNIYANIPCTVKYDSSATEKQLEVTISKTGISNQSYNYIISETVVTHLPIAGFTSPSPFKITVDRTNSTSTQLIYFNEDGNDIIGQGIDHGGIIDGVTVGDELELFFVDTATPPSFTGSMREPVAINDQENLDQMFDKNGWTYTSTNPLIPDLNFHTPDGKKIYITFPNPTSVEFAPEMYTPLPTGTDDKSFTNYEKEEIFESTSENDVPGKPALPYKEPGNPDELNVGDYVFQEYPGISNYYPNVIYQVKSKYVEDGKTCIVLSEEANPQDCQYQNVIVKGVPNVVPVFTPLPTWTGQLRKFTHLSSVAIGDNSTGRMIDKKQIDELNQDILWHFYVNGAGKYYNGIYIKGVRNSTYDKMYTNEDGDPEYPYAFMDVAIYRDNNDGTSTLLEGPWTVSLMDRTSKDVVIKDIYTGLQMYLPVVINRKSKIVRCVECRGVDQLVTMNVPVPYQPDTERRMHLQDLISGKLADYPDGIRMKNGSDGNMFDSMGRINLTDELIGLLCQAYEGNLKSTDGSIERLLSVIYPWYLIDYIYCGGWGHNVNFSAKTLADLRNDCLLLSDTGLYKESHDEDMEARAQYVPWNTWNAALYTNYRKIFDAFTSKSFYVSPIYHAIDRHLYTDDRYWIAEPVAGIEKGAIEEAIELAYGTNETQLADEIDVELNPVIIEADGTYILQQFTTWKRLSIMKRQHVVKFVQYCKKKLPGILKDILHRKATNYWIKQAESRVNTFMIPFVDNGDTNRYAAVSTFSVQCSFDDESSELTVLLTIKPLRSIEKITVNIIVT